MPSASRAWRSSATAPARLPTSSWAGRKAVSDATSGSVPGLLLVVLLLDVHGPGVVVLALEDVLDREHRREHGVVLVVVLVHPVPPDGVDVGGVLGQPAL